MTRSRTPLLIAALLAGCGASPADKSGSTSGEPVTLTVQMPDVDSESGREFVRAVAQRSEGTVRVRIGKGRYDSVDPQHELQLAKALQRGAEQAGYLPARAWSAAGIGPFQALLAPFALTTPDATAAFATSEGARDVLGALPKDVVGLALVPDQLRRVLSTRTAITPAQLEGQRIRIIDDPQSAADLRALGAEPVEGLVAEDVPRQISHGDLDGAETAGVPAYNNNYGSIAHHLTGYALFPKFQSLVVSRKTWDKLSGAQQAAMRAAARDTVEWANRHAVDGESESLGQLCRQGVSVDVPNASQLRSLVAASRPATDELAADKASAAVLSAMRSVPGAGPHQLATPLPRSCTAPAAPEPVKVKTPPFPEGTFVTKTRKKDYVAHDVTNPTSLHDVTFTTRLHDGRWVQIQHPSFSDQCPGSFAKAKDRCAGTYAVRGDQVTFKWGADGSVAPEGTTEVVKWSYFNDVLRFKNVSVADTAARTIYDTPWRKAG